MSQSAAGSPGLLAANALSLVLLKGRSTAGS